MKLFVKLCNVILNCLMKENPIPFKVELNHWPDPWAQILFWRRGTAPFYCYEYNPHQEEFPSDHASLNYERAKVWVDCWNLNHTTWLNSETIDTDRIRTNLWY